MSDISRVQLWFRNQFREAPWTWGLISCNTLIWMLAFFNVPQPAQLIQGPLGLETAWRWLLYPLFTPLPILSLVLSLLAFYFFSTPLERLWGSTKYARVFVTLTLSTALMFYLGTAVLTKSASPSVTMVAGLIHVELSLFVIWTAIHSEATVLALFFIPVKAWWLSALFLILALVQYGPILGLFAIATPIAGWFWAKRDGGYPGRPAKSLSQRFQEKKREVQKSRFKVLPGKGMDAGDAEHHEANLRAVRRAEEEKKKTAEQAELDRILDKIRFEGMEALSPKEKETLDSHSKKLNGGN